MDEMAPQVHRLLSEIPSLRVCAKRENVFNP